MYFQSVYKVLKQAMKGYRLLTGTPEADIDAQVTAHIVKTASEHQNPAPNINYEDPLCRLGYLYVHAAANAHLFEQVVRRSASLQRVIHSHPGGELTACAVGGGPGTEMLGLSKYLSAPAAGLPGLPKRMNFVVLDRVAPWGETWQQLASACEDVLAGIGPTAPIISPSFHPMNVVDPASYDSYAWLFAKVDVFVFNYLLSENQIHLDQFKGALAKMVARARAGSHFVVIDRFEQHTDFRKTVSEMFDGNGLEVVDEITIGGCMSEGEEPVQEFITRFGGRRPRRWFKPYGVNVDTVFAIVSKVVKT